MIANMFGTIRTLLLLLCCMQAHIVYANSTFDVIVSKKDTLASIFKRYGLRQKDLYQMLDQVQRDEVTKLSLVSHPF